MRGNGYKSNQWTKTDEIIAGTLLRENVEEQNDGNTTQKRQRRNHAEIKEWAIAMTLRQNTG